MTDRDTGNEALRAAFEEWCIRFELNSSSVYVRDQWQSALAVGAAYARAEENEACAKVVADKYSELYLKRQHSGYKEAELLVAAGKHVNDIERAIRDRQEKRSGK